MSAHSHNLDVISQFTRQAIPFTQLPGHGDAIKLLVEMAQVDADSRVLDVACGPGLVAAAFASQVAQVDCLDLTPAMLAQVEGLARAQQLKNLVLQQGDAMALPYSNSSFDCVLTRYSFHHFLHPEQVFAEMLRVCKPGGRVLVADVEIGVQQADSYNHIEKLRDSSHVRALTPSDFMALFAQPQFARCTKACYSVDVALEQQLSVSFPKPGNKQKIRALINADIDANTTGFNPRLVDGEVHYSYPIAVYVGTLKA